MRESRRARKLSELLKKYEELLDLREREETIDRLLEYEHQNSSMLQMVSIYSRFRRQSRSAS